MLQDVNRLLDAETVEAVWGYLLARMQGFGFGRLLYACSRVQMGERLDDAANALVLSNHSKEYLDRFIGEGLYRHAPMVRWANENEGVCNWRCIDEMLATGTVTADERKVITFNQRHGLNAGMTISFSSLAVRARGGIGLVAREGLTHDDVEDIWRRHSDEILALCRVAHLKIICLPPPQTASLLSPRQREALEWVAEGKTTLDIAVLMGVSVATVEKHLRLAREALEVDNTAQAIAKATVTNQIFKISAPMRRN